MIKSTLVAAASIFAALLCVSTTSAFANSSAPLGGETTSQMLCSRCHDTTGTKSLGRKLGDGSAPPFVMIAQDPKMTPSALRSFLRLPHGKMAVLTLSQSEIDGLITYIQSFGTTPTNPAGAN